MQNSPAGARTSRTTNRRVWAIGFLLVMFLGVAIPCASAAYPDRPLRLIVPFPAGNPLDVRARQLANHLPALLGQQVIVDNRGGASGVIAMEIAAKAAPDGYTLLFANSTQLASNPAMAGKLPYDVFRDYAPVSLLARTPSLFVVSNSIPAKSLKELIALAKAKPGSMLRSTRRCRPQTSWLPPCGKDRRCSAAVRRNSRRSSRSSSRATRSSSGTRACASNNERRLQGAVRLT